MSRDNNFQVGKYYRNRGISIEPMQLVELRPCKELWKKMYFPNADRCQFCSGYRLYFKNFGECCQSDINGELYFTPILETNERW